MDFDSLDKDFNPLSNPIIRYILIFVVINVLLWGGQEIYHYSDTQKIKEIDSFLQTEKSLIINLEAKISSEESEIENLKSELELYKTLGYIDSYNSEVDNFNNLLEQYKSDLYDYNLKLTNYNNKVDEENILIKKSSSRWYLIPIPLPGKSAKPKL